MAIESFIQKSFRHISRHIHDNGTMTIISGVNSFYFEPLMTILLPSIEEFEPNVNLYIWDLGLTEDELGSINCWFSTTNHVGGVMSLPFNNLPDHFQMSRFSYAFKSYCIYNTMIKNETDYYFWLDSQCKLREPLFPERTLFKIYGFYSPYSRTTVNQLTYHTVLEEFCENHCHYGDNRMLSAGTVAVNVHDSRAVALITEWYQLSYRENLISPEGSNKSNHRQDQSLLSLCYYSRYKKVPLLERRLYHVRIHCW